LEDNLSFKQRLQKVFLCLFLAGSFLGSHMSHKQIEDLLYSANQPRAEESIEDEVDNSKTEPNP
jgi:hypothetical protein